MKRLHLKRVYDAPAAADGLRILVDRLWPRGVSKEAARIDLWLKELAPSDALRRQFCHELDRWPAFREHYTAELRANPALDELREQIAQQKATTLLFAAKDTEHNNAVVLYEFLGGDPKAEPAALKEAGHAQGARKAASHRS